MAIFERILSVSILSITIISLLFIYRTSTEKLDEFDLERIPCETECECYGWMPNRSASKTYEKFTVNCIGWKHGFLQGLTLPPIQSGTVDFVHKDNDWGFPYKLNRGSFETDPMEQQVKSLVLRGRNITHVSYKTFNVYSIRLLHHVDLSSNMIEEVYSNTFTFQSNLKSISVANNNIRRVGRHAFKNLRQLEQLNLSQNSLKEIHFNILRNVPSLKILDLSHNMLKTLPQTLKNVPNLNNLDLSNNRFRNLPWDNLSQLPFLKELGLRGNPWKCDCQMKGILKVNRSLLVGSQAACQFVRGTLLEDLNLDTFSYCPVTNPKSFTRLDFLIIYALHFIIFYVGAFTQALQVMLNFIIYRRLRHFVVRNFTPALHIMLNFIKQCRPWYLFLYLGHVRRYIVPPPLFVK
jgi:hypothetical protein